jgi:hypothetical protein
MRGKAEVRAKDSRSCNPHPSRRGGRIMNESPRNPDLCPRFRRRVHGCRRRLPRIQKDPASRRRPGLRAPPGIETSCVAHSKMKGGRT